MKKLINKIREINDKHLGYSKNDIKYVLMMIIGVLIICTAGLKYRQIMGLIIGSLTVLTSIYLFIREGDRDAQNKSNQKDGDL